MWSFSKRFSCICCTFLTTFSFLLSADNGNCYDYSSDVYGDPYNCYDSSYGDYSDGHWRFGVEFLYWNSYGDCLEIGSSIKRDRKIARQRVEVKIKNLDFKWKPGFRLNLGYRNPDCFWDFNSHWTCYYGFGKAIQGGIKDNSSHITSQEWGWNHHPLKSFPLQKSDRVLDSCLKGKWGLNYNVCEFGVGHAYDIGDCFILRPHMGLKLAWLHKCYTTSFNRHLRLAVGSSLEEEGDVHCKLLIKQKWRICGPQVGLDGVCDLGCGWSIYLTGAASILHAHPSIGHHSVVRSSGFQSPKRMVLGQSYSSLNHDKLLLYAADITAGFGWNSWLCDSTYLLGMKLGWEHHIWLFPRCYEFGNLALFGLNASIGLDY